MILMQAIGTLVTVFISIYALLNFIMVCILNGEHEEKIEKLTDRIKYLEHKVLDITMYLENKRKR